MNVLDKPLSNLQLELIKIFSYELSDSDLLEVKRILSKHFADKASDEVDRLWEDKKWSNDDMDAWLQGKS